MSFTSNLIDVAKILGLACVAGVGGYGLVKNMMNGKKKANPDIHTEEGRYF